MVCTPHMFAPQFANRSPEAIRARFDDTLAELRRLAAERPELAFLDEMELYLGAENYFSPELLEAIEARRVLTLNATTYLLVEFSSYLSFELLQEAARRILSAGFFPVLAHVERYAVLRRDRARLAELTAMGCVAQVNADSVLGSLVSAQRRATLGFLKSGLATVVASDTHDAGSRRSRLDESLDLLCRKFGVERASAWFDDNPRRILGAAAPGAGVEYENPASSDSLEQTSPSSRTTERRTT